MGRLHPLLYSRGKGGSGPSITSGHIVFLRWLDEVGPQIKVSTTDNIPFLQIIDT